MILIIIHFRTSYVVPSGGTQYHNCQQLVVNSKYLYPTVFE